MTKESKSGARRVYEYVATFKDNTKFSSVSIANRFPSLTRDSRDFGDVPLSDVVGRPRQIWFSSGEGGVRWDRIGMGVQGGG
jgi:hypothetical protein